MKKTLLFLIIISFTTSLSSQITFEKWFGNEDWDIGYSVEQTADDGYIIGGLTTINDTSKIYLLKTNQYGDTTWTKHYPNAILEEDIQYVAHQTPDGGYIVGATYCSADNDTIDFFLIKTDEVGNISWQNQYENTGNDIGMDLINTEDGGFIICGMSLNFMQILKLDQNGNIVWNRVYNELGFAFAVSIIEIDDGYVVAGHKDINEESYFSIMKIDFDNTITWQQTYSITASHILNTSICQTQDDGFVLVSINNEYQGCVIKTNHQGDTLWTKNYDNYDYNIFRSVVCDNNGDYVITGEIIDIDSDCSDLCIVKISPNGEIIFIQIFDVADAEEEGYCIANTNDGGYIVTGLTIVDDCAKLYLIKVNSDGNVAQITKNSNEQKIIIYPNPASNFINIVFNDYQNEQIDIEIIDITGKIISQQTITQNIYNYDITTYKSGIYFIKIQYKNELQIKKLIV